MVDEEKALLRELHTYSEKFDQWEADQPPDSARDQKPVRVRKATSISDRLYKAPNSAQNTVTDSLLPSEENQSMIKKQLDLIDKQIRELGGPDCGWPPADQKDFLKVWTKHGGKQVIAFNNEVMRQCPIYSEEQVATHVRTYR